MDNRIHKYFALSTAISYMSDKQISALMKDKESSARGKNVIVTINNQKVFIKKIPLTKLEYDNQFDTANLYNLPTFYNYGIGSAGINAYRELEMHIKTTNWVLNGDIENFPLMYHYRIIRNDTSLKHFKDKNEIEKYVKKWNNDKNIEKYIIARDNAEYEILLFIEYFQNILYEWLKPDAKQITYYISQIIKIVDFLKKNNIIHFDAHAANIVSDGEKIYLTDFGLVLDMNFNLTKEEERFFKNNNYYDYAMILSNIIRPLLGQIAKEKEYFNKKYHFDAILYSQMDYFEKIYDNLDEIGAYLKYDNEYIQILKKYWQLLIMAPVFHYNMQHNDKKNDILPNNTIKKLVEENIQDGGYYYKYHKYKNNKNHNMKIY